MGMQVPVPLNAGRRPPWMQPLLLHLENIAFSHTVFALPFLILGYVAPSATGSHGKAGPFLFLVLAAVFARSYAMAVNRLVDLPFDRLNPRTARRPLPAKALSPRSVTLFALFALIGFVLCVQSLGDPAVWLLPITLLFLTGYSFLKRFTWLSHFWLGATLAQAPLAGWLVAAHRLPPTAWLLAGGVFFWVAGFDILYALDDREFDRQIGLHSLPVAAGDRQARFWAALLHLAALVLFGLFTAHLPQPLWAWVGWLCLLATIEVEHAAVASGKYHIRFGIYNGAGSVAYAALSLMALFLRLR